MERGNLYRTHKPDFAALARKYPGFKKYVHTTRFGVPNINWKDPYAVRELTYVLLKDDFHLELDIPIDQLCPAVPNRANYIHWLHDLLAVNSPTLLTRQVRGIDIGAGASCIYPLLGARLYGWSFLATDIDPESIKYAKRNVILNRMERQIALRLAPPEKILIGVLTDTEDEEEFAFCMCNPPFFSEENEKQVNPRTTCSITPSEMVTVGGEFEFVRRIIRDSLVLRQRVRWYTTMLGRKVDLKLLERELAALGVSNVRSTTFYQGRTTRWGIAWSFTTDGLAKYAEAWSNERRGRGKAQETCFAVMAPDPVKLLRVTKRVLASLGINFAVGKDDFTLTVQVTPAVWAGIDETNTNHSGSNEATNDEQITANYEIKLKEVEAALALYPEEPALQHLKKEIDDLLSLTQNMSATPSASNRNVLTNGNGALQDGHPQSSSASASPPALFEFELRIVQSQPRIYMLSFDWESKQAERAGPNAKLPFYQLFNYVKEKLSSKFKRV